MDNKIELTHDELIKLNQVLEFYVEQQNAIREQTGSSSEDEKPSLDLMTLRSKIEKALKEPKEKDYNVFFI